MNFEEMAREIVEMVLGLAYPEDYNQFEKNVRKTITKAYTQGIEDERKKSAALIEAFDLAVVRMGIMNGRMRACKWDKGNTHELLHESESFEEEARQALAAYRGQKDV